VAIAEAVIKAARKAIIFEGTSVGALNDLNASSVGIESTAIFGPNGGQVGIVFAIAE